MLALKRHPQSRGAQAVQVQVEALRPRPDQLFLRYLLTGAVSRLRLPPEQTPARTDELWRHTCLEAFLRTAGPAYYEFNFAPSTRWAIYRLGSYRTGMTTPEAVRTPQVSALAGPPGYEVRVEVDLGGLPELSAPRAWRLGLSAVLEDAEGAISYWALAHPPGKPDFHHLDSLVLDLPPETSQDPA
ncbi:MAG: DOMON-like domain-containing protein [Proteobacteria bacterium]|nr:DOMON-like domain-containing protein [Pseudomonadota bacterium]